MKLVGRKSEFQSERDSDLLRAFFKYIRDCDYIYMPDVFKSVVDMPASRFWVSAPRATIVVTAISRGDKLSYMRPNKREMFFEIYNRVCSLKAIHSDWPLPRLVRDVIEQPAPKFYLAPGSARIFILKARKKWHATNSSKPQHCL